MAGENNVNVGNGSVPNTTAQSTAATSNVAPAVNTENILTTIVLTLWDVVVFLAVSIGYIFQVSTRFASSRPLHTWPTSPYSVHFLCRIEIACTGLFEKQSEKNLLIIFITVFVHGIQFTHTHIGKKREKNSLLRQRRGREIKKTFRCWLLKSANDLRTFDVIPFHGTHQFYSFFFVVFDVARTRNRCLVQCKQVWKSVFFSLLDIFSTMNLDPSYF